MANRLETVPAFCSIDDETMFECFERVVCGLTRVADELEYNIDIKESPPRNRRSGDDAEFKKAHCWNGDEEKQKLTALGLLELYLDQTM